MPKVNLTSPQPPHIGTSNGVGVITSNGTKYTMMENNNHSNTNGDSIHNTSAGDDVGGGNTSGSRRSFIQQRVERLYGPGALAQGFYSPKKIGCSPQRSSKTNGHEQSTDGGATSELARKFQELSPSKDYNQFRKKLHSNGRPSIPTSASSSSSDNVNTENNNIDLPCLRHLSQEFRAQLPIVSPKRNLSRTSPPKEMQPNSSTTLTTATTTQNHSTSNGTTIRSTTTTINTTSTTNLVNTNSKKHVSNLDFKSHESNSLSTAPPPPPAGMDEVDRQSFISLEEVQLQTPLPLIKSEKEQPVNVKTPTPNTVHAPNDINETVGFKAATAGTSVASVAQDVTTNGTATTNVKDAHFFLKQLKSEQARLLVMAVEAEKYLDALASNPDVTEDTLGLLRSASGKARLLVSQKMKQFEGLCHKNLISSPKDQFPTTVDDLQGFWDMVYLQVDHIDAIFKEIEMLKTNDWKSPIELELPASTPNTLKTPKPLKHFGKSRSNTPQANGGGSGSGNTPSAAAIKREAQRKKLQDMKRRNREALMAASTAAPELEGTDTVEDGLQPL